MELFNLPITLADPLTLATIALASYVFGAVPFAYAAAKFGAGVKLTNAGTGNVGVMNAFKSGNRWVGIVSVVGEISKAAFAVLAATALAPNDLAAQLIALFCAFLGTNFSIFLRFSGGLGSTVFLWGQLFVEWPIAATITAISIALFLVSKLGTDLRQWWFVSIPFVIYIITSDIPYTVFGLVTALIFALRSTKSNDDFRHFGYTSRHSASANREVK